MFFIITQIKVGEDQYRSC